MSMTLLQLLQLSDTALPIGALNHSFGLETLVSEDLLRAEGLESFLYDYLHEVIELELRFCGTSYRLGSQGLDVFSEQAWLDVNTRVGAFKLARESRIASATLGRRLLHLVNGLTKAPTLVVAAEAAEQTETDVHHCTAFGLAGSALGVGEETTILAYGHQSLANLISACQRLLPVGQTQAAVTLWELKPTLAELVTRARKDNFDTHEFGCFAPLVEIGSMRHPRLATRLFIS
jgi:urease accessory protein